MSQLDVLYGYHQLGAADVNGRLVAVIDVLRASTSVAIALANGARAVVPFETSEEAVARAKQLGRDDVRLAGEQRLRPIPGFDIGNSPGEFTAEVVSGKTVFLATTNGSAAILAVQGAREIVIASYVNFSAVAAMLRAAARGGEDIALVCAGQERRFALEDAACAGRYVRTIAGRGKQITVTDGAHASMLIDRKYGDDLQRLFADSSHGRALVDAGFEDDLEICARLDSHPVVPVYHDRQIVRIGERAR